MKNKFYQKFDYETLEEDSALDYRTSFQRERDRLIHSAAFRRLQAKTQVFISGEYDFYRTRLTHSIEVAQIGRSICNYLNGKKPLGDKFYIDSDLVEAVSLAHDLGHPPFGHAGERTLNRLMKPFGGFEGNAQTLRTLTHLLYSDKGKRKGMNPSRALIDGVLKYKTLFHEFETPVNHYIYDDQSEYLSFVFKDREFSSDIPAGKPRNSFRSLECQIMDWADDTAYSLNDIVDGINADFITLHKLEEWARESDLSKNENAFVESLLNSMKTGSYERDFARKIGNFIRACRISENRNFMSDLTNRYLFSIEIDPGIREESEFYKRISFELVFRSARLNQLDFKWNQILTKLFDSFTQTYLTDKPNKLKILPDEAHHLIKQQSDKSNIARIICDQIAGMTDGFAIRTFKRLYDADFGSIVDLV